MTSFPGEGGALVLLSTLQQTQSIYRRLLKG